MMQVCVNVCVRVCVCAICTHGMWRPEAHIRGFPNHSLSYMFGDRISHWTWSCQFWPDWLQQASPHHLSSCPSAGIIGMYSHAQHFTGADDLNSCPPACLTGTLCPESSPQPYLVLKTNNLSTKTNHYILQHKNHGLPFISVKCCSLHI